jgi:glycosyltransferase involved in cell wall biosynthesis
VRVLHAIQELTGGGAEQVVQALVCGTRAAGDDVAVAAAMGPLASVTGNAYPLPLVERRPWRVPGAALALHRALRSFRPDLLHVHNPAMASVAALVTARGRRPPALVTVHGVPDEDYGAAARVLRLAGLAAIACGPGVAAGLEEHGFRVADTIVNGVAPAPPAASREDLFEDLGVPPGGPLVIAVGRLVPLKNHALAIEALVDVPSTTLLLVGDGPQRDPLAAAARRHGVDERVVFAGYRHDARALMGAADAVVLTSLSEGLPLAALEALAAGKPLVATSIRGVRELLHDGENAVLVPPDDPEALATALRRVLDQEGLRDVLRQGALRAAAGYTEDAMVAAYRGLYEKLLSR